MGTRQIRNIIFDLGGVILDIDVDLTRQAMARLGNVSPEEIQENYYKLGFFRQYEKGYIDDDAFRDELRKLLGRNYEDRVLDDAWCALLLGIPKNKARWVKEASRKYNIYLLSNTNHLHTHVFHRFWEENTGEPDFSYTFRNVHYSFLMHKRKPEPEIFQQVFEENDLKPEETLMIDDTIENIHMAAALGMQTLLVEKNQQKIQIPD